MCSSIIVGSWRNWNHNILRGVKMKLQNRYDSAHKLVSDMGIKEKLKNNQIFDTVAVLVVCLAELRKLDEPIPYILLNGIEYKRLDDATKILMNLQDW